MLVNEVLFWPCFIWLYVTGCCEDMRKYCDGIDSVGVTLGLVFARTGGGLLEAIRNGGVYV